MSGGNAFAKPAAVSDLDMAFGGRMQDLLPPWASIPADFKQHDGTQFNRVVSEWFFRGLPQETEFHPRDGIDLRAALRHVGAVLRSWEPKHEHKEAGAAYLLSLWFERIELPARSAA